jgi:hypothetical protein
MGKSGFDLGDVIYFYLMNGVGAALAESTFDYIL